VTTVEYEGEKYHDDRMFVLYLCKGTIAESDGQTITTTIYHENAPADYKWCLVTYRNIARYPAIRVDDFESIEEARAYLERIEPTVPRISLGGRSPRNPLPYKEWLEWKAVNQVKEYDYKQMFSPGGTNPRESVISKKR
jgi:hypothetical protein